jgi:sugar phosphate isomerase/epimerase
MLVAIFALSGCSPKEVAPQWKLGVQTYTFHNFTLKEALDKTQQLGLHYAEAYFGQELGQGFPDSLWLDYNLPAETKKQLQEQFAAHNIKWYASGVASYDNEADWRKFFGFASEMGLKVVTVEPKLEDLDLVEKLAKEFNVEVAIHNHPAPSIYANPDVLAKALEGRSNLMGVCADIGHWKRFGADPLETIKRFKGRLKVVHMKDLTAKLEDAQWGTGILPVKEVVKELKNQNFEGMISVEYENYSGSQMDDIAKSLDYFNNIAK